LPCSADKIAGVEQK